MAHTFNIINETRSKLPLVDFIALKDGALGKKYNLTVIITTPARMKELNTIYRDKKQATDILSFPISKNEGEIYLCLSESRKEAPKFERSYENFIPFLFIHGCVHLLGHDHGAIMDGIEVKLRRKFDI